MKTYQQIKEAETEGYLNPMGIHRSLCGNTIFGTISSCRFNELTEKATREQISLKSLICGLIMMSLKPTLNDFSKNMVFSIRVNLRDDVSKSKTFGLYYRDIIIECPLSLIDDRAIQFSGYRDHVGITAQELETYEKVYEQQFKDVTTYIQNVMNEKIGYWKTDNDIKMMKMMDDMHQSKDEIIQINDLTEIDINENLSQNDPYCVKSSSMVTSLSKKEMFSVSYTHCEASGLTISIHIPKMRSMESFVENFQAFLDE